MKIALPLLLAFLLSSCIATAADLERIRLDVRRVQAAGTDNGAELQQLGETIGSVVADVEGRAWDWSELILAVGGAVTGTGVLTGAAVNKIRDKRRVLRNEPTGIAPTAPTV